jgi:hypothetical protein
VGGQRKPFLRTVDTLTTEFGIYSWDFLPYEAVLIILCYVYSRLEKPEKLSIAKLKQWFWRSAVSQRYRVGGENFVSKDLGAVLAFLTDEKGKKSDFGNPPASDEIWERLPFRAQNSISLAYVLALARQSPRNITNGAQIDTAIALSHFNKKEFHHLFPKGFLKRAKIVGEPNAIANICMLAASENKAVSDQDPRVYLPACIARLGTLAGEVFASNALPSPGTFDYSACTYPQFLQERSAIIGGIVRCLCD